MGLMVRKQVYLEPQQEALLKRLSRQLGVTEAEVIRRAIDSQAQMVLPARRDLTAWEAERAFIARLIQEGPVGGKRTWRREDLYDR